MSWPQVERRRKKRPLWHRSKEEKAHVRADAEELSKKVAQVETHIEILRIVANGG